MERDDFLQQTPSGKLRKAVINHEASTLNARPAQAASEASVVETGAQAFLPDEVIVSETSTVQPMSAEAAGDLGVVGNEKKTPLQKAVFYHEPKVVQPMSAEAAGDLGVVGNEKKTPLQKAVFYHEPKVVQSMSAETASASVIDQAVYLIPIRRIRDDWILRYMQKKAQTLQQALAERRLPPRCSSKERWHDRKCKDYCQVAEHCPYGKVLKISTGEAEQERPPA